MPVTFDHEDSKALLGKSVAFLESSILLLSSQLAEASAREAALTERLVEFQSVTSAVGKLGTLDSQAEMSELKAENDLLHKLNKHLQGEVARKNKVLESAASAPPLLHDEAALSSELGPLKDVLSLPQIHAVLELLSLGINPKDVHCLLLGISETKADLTSFLHLAGVLCETFDAAEEARNAVNSVSGCSDTSAEPPSTSASSTDDRVLLTRDRMVELLRQNDVKQLAALGLPHTLLAEISLATLSGLDPWSIVNLLDGRLRRNSRLDITMAPSLGGALAQKSPSRFGLDSEVATILSSLSRSCSLSPMRALRDRNLDLERTNHSLLQQVEELNALMAVRQCKWTSDMPGRPLAVAPDLWRVDSFGSSGMPSPASPASLPSAPSPSSAMATAS
mmetsp:Transcript_20442/g.56649  ORF Transcript_20442/g.56649 Transcript_20442/m.56649 type:complete len:393 (-) Transcript_20442:412-1590(-)